MPARDEFCDRTFCWEYWQYMFYNFKVILDDMYPCYELVMKAKLHVYDRVMFITPKFYSLNLIKLLSNTHSCKCYLIYFKNRTNYHFNCQFSFCCCNKSILLSLYIFRNGFCCENIYWPLPKYSCRIPVKVHLNARMYLNPTGIKFLHFCVSLPHTRIRQKCISWRVSSLW